MVIVMFALSVTVFEKLAIYKSSHTHTHAQTHAHTAKDKDVDYRKICKTDLPKNHWLFHYKRGLLRTASTLSASNTLSGGRSVSWSVGRSVRVFNFALCDLVINLKCRRSWEIHIWLYIGLYHVALYRRRSLYKLSSRLVLREFR